jgi:hypothetical protein
VVGRRTLLVVLVVASAAAAPAHASEPLSDVNVQDLKLAVNRKGEALLTYRRESGAIRRVLVWGAIDARPPDPNVPQVRFKYDYAGGWGKYRRLYWKTFGSACGRYDGPGLVYLVAACKAPDGSYWAAQAWVRQLPLLGFAPFLPFHDDVEVHVSHWSAPPAVLEVSQNWAYDLTAQSLFGRLSYAAAPVHGFGSTRTGNPTDRYGRNVYIDTFNSAYGPGWKRESGILVHRPTGTFCHSFVPQRPFPDYPSQALRPAAHGERYRVTVMGPGVTPVLQWEGRGLTNADKASDGEFNKRFDEVMAGDRICAGER